MDNLTAEQRVRTMRAVRAANTTPELKVRRMIFAWGYRYRLHDRKLPGCPDIIFSSMRKIIFVHGCFWHGHRCPAGLNRPRSNSDYWETKLERNRSRDVVNREKLRKLHWKTLVLWECELRKIASVERRVRTFLEE